MADSSSVSYVGRDQTDIRRELITLVPYLTEKWKDFNSSDLGVTIVELIAGAQDLQNFYFDNQAYETFLDTAQQEYNVRSHLRNMNYRIPFKGSAKGLIRLYFKTPQTIRISKYSQLSTFQSSAYRYAVKDTVTLHANTMVTDTDSLYYGFYYDKDTDVEVVEGVLRSFTINKSTLVNQKTQDGYPSRRIYLEGGDSKSYSDGSLWINQKYDQTLGKLVTWEECDDALLKYEGGPYYSLHMDSYGEVYMYMSVDFLDYLPTKSDVTVYWLQTLGTGGISYQGTETQISKFVSLRDINGKAITIEQLSNTSGAYDTPNVLKLKTVARRQAQTLGRYITLDDYKNGVESEPYISNFKVKDWKSPKYVNVPYQVKIWALNQSGENLSSVDIKTLKNKFYSKGVTDVEILYVPTKFVKIRIDVNIVIKTSTEDNRRALEDLVKENLLDYAKYENHHYGEIIYIIDRESRIKTFSSYIKRVHVDFYVGEEKNITEYSGYSDLDFSDVEIYHGIPMDDLKEELKKVHSMIDHGLEEVSDDYNLSEIYSYKDLKYITWVETGDISLDEIEFPKIYSVNVTSTTEDPEVEL